MGALAITSLTVLVAASGAHARSWHGPQQLASSRDGGANASVALSDSGRALAAWGVPLPNQDPEDHLLVRGRVAFGSVGLGFGGAIALPGVIDADVSPPIAAGDAAGDQLVHWFDGTMIRRGNAPLRMLEPIRSESGIRNEFGPVHVVAVTPTALLWLTNPLDCQGGLCGVRLVLHARTFDGVELPPVQLASLSNFSELGAWQIATNRKGDALIVWGIGSTGAAFATVRHADGTLEARRAVGHAPVVGSRGAMSAAINRRGDAVVAWGTLAAYRPAGRPWQAWGRRLANASGLTNREVALDEHGGAVVATSELNPSARTSRGNIRVAVRQPTGRWAVRLFVGQRGSATAHVFLRADAQGDDLIAWDRYLKTTGSRLPARWAYRPARRSFSSPQPLPKRLQNLVVLDDLAVNARGQAILIGHGGQHCNIFTGVRCTLQAGFFR